MQTGAEAQHEAIDKGTLLIGGNAGVFGPVVTYYFARIMGRAYPFVGVGASLSWSTYHTSAPFGGAEGL